MQFRTKGLYILFFFLMGLPLLGILYMGRNLASYMEFPPNTLYVPHEPFFLPFFLGMVLVTAIILLPFILQGVRYCKGRADQKPTAHSFPRWGYGGICAGVIFWLLAWTRFGWFAFFQHHTFTPLWLSYIVVINALTYSRTGRCMLTDKTRYLLVLFPVSALFWWFFEYLNRFVQNWFYLEVSHFSSLEYALFATMSFSTVLPAVLGTKEWLMTFPIFKRAFGSYKRIDFPFSQEAGFAIIIISGISLVCIGIFPNYLYPLLWISPLLIIIGLQALWGESHIFSEIPEGDWSNIVSSALAALICGLFWEMWNYNSLAKWVYTVPFVQRYHIFEMPLIGFAGYIPFGLECLAVGALLEEENV